MEELFIAMLELIEESDLIAEGALIISEEVLAENAFSLEMIGEIFSNVVASLSVFKEWMVTTFELSEKVVNALLTLQIMYDMVYTHANKVRDSGRCISVTAAMRDMEGTMIKNHSKIQDMAAKQVASANFSKLPQSIQDKLKETADLSPMAYWISVKVEIMKSLMKIPIYTLN